MPPGRRLAALLAVLALVAVPPVVLRALCLGKTCEGDSSAAARVPFCPLPPAVKELIAAGYRSGRSPDVLGVTASGVLQGGSDPADAGAPWPAVSPAPDTRVPILMFGDGVASGFALPDGTQLDQIAPSLAEVVGFRRAHPDVREGTPVPGIATGNPPRLVVEIVWRGIGTADLEAARAGWPYLGTLLRSDRAATFDGDTGSVPLDPAATLTTIGTGGPPAQHGITGSLVRNDRGQVVRVWESGAPTSVISTLPDDLDFSMHEAPRIGLVATDGTDRGIVGGTWYIPHDRDDVTITRGDPLPAVRRMLGDGYGADSAPDVLAVVLDGPIRLMDARTKAIIAAARATRAPTAFVVTATGEAAPSADGGAAVARRVDASVESIRPIVEASVPGGLFLDQEVLAESELSSNAAVQAMLELQGPSGDEKLFADAFPGFAVSFGRYCR